MAQIIRITSEALQATIRRLLPSQQGFGEDLQASNVIMPIIDLTPTAEGSELPQSLQQAINFTDATEINCNNATVTIINQAGFWRVTAVSTVNGTGSATVENRINIVENLTTKVVWRHTIGAGGTQGSTALDVDLVFFLPANVTLQATSNSTSANFRGSVRQVADVNGNLLNPTGFNSQ